MKRYAIMRSNGTFIEELPVGRERFRDVNEIEKATLYTKEVVAKDKLIALKFHRNNINDYKIVEVEIVYKLNAI